MQCCLLILHVNESLGMGIAEVTFVRWPAVDLCLVEGVLDLVGIHACR